MFFLCVCNNIKLKQLRRQSVQSKSLKRILGAENTIFNLGRREEKVTYKRFKQNFRGKKSTFRLKK